ncbi:acyloxyacyl hydrolase [Nitratifractor sp.]
MMVLLLLAPVLSFGGGDLTPTPASDKALFDAVSFSYGQSKDNIDIYRLGLQRDFESRWFESSVGYLSGYYELSLNYWNGRGDENYGIALSPVFAYYFKTSETFHPYLEAGIGASLFSRTRMGPRDLSTNFLFEDRVGIGFRTGNWDLAFRYMHYSNANIKQPNDGIDIFLGSLSYRF